MAANSLLNNANKSDLLNSAKPYNDDLNLAIESLLNESNNDLESSTANISSDSNINSAQKTVTNFELVAQSSKTTPLKTSLISPLPKTTKLVTTGSSINISQSTLAAGTKIKMIPSNQFVQLKPPMQSQSKIYTIKTTGMLNNSGTQSPVNATAAGNIGNIVQTSGQQQIFTLKSPNGQTTQFVTAAPAAAQQKYTVVKNAAGGTSLQLTSAAGKTSSSTGSNVDLSNIIDMPIVFADNEGNISDAVNNEAAASNNTRKSGKICGLFLFKTQHFNFHKL